MLFLPTHPALLKLSYDVIMLLNIHKTKEVLLLTKYMMTWMPNLFSKEGQNT